MYFKEGVAIDYKWFDKEGIAPRYEFGFGLTYSKFKLSDLRVNKEYRPVRDTVQQTNEKHKGKYDLYDTLYIARVTVKNVGKVYAGEAPQLVGIQPLTLAGRLFQIQPQLPTADQTLTTVHVFP